MAHSEAYRVQAGMKKSERGWDWYGDIIGSGGTVVKHRACSVPGGGSCKVAQIEARATGAKS